MTSAATRPDLPAARERFADQVHALVGRRTTWINRDDASNTIVFGDSRWQQLLDYRPGGTGDRGASVARSVPPIAVDAVSLIDLIDRTVRTWWPAGHRTEGDTPHRLHQLVDHQWTPIHVGGLHVMADELVVWCKRIDDLLDPPKRWSIPAPCPACSTSTVYRPDSAGESVRQPALQINTSGCACLSCGASWEPAYFAHLARTLGTLPTNVLE